MSATHSLSLASAWKLRTTKFAKRLQSCGEVDAITINIVTFDDHLTDIHTDA